MTPVVRYRAVAAFAAAAVAAPLALHAAQPAILGTFEDGDIAIAFADPGANLPTPVQELVELPAGSLPHGVAYIAQDEALIADFGTPARLYRVTGSNGALLATIPVPGKRFGNGTIAVSPDGNTAIFAGEATIDGVNLAQAVVLRAPFDGTGSQHALALPGVVQSFNTQAVAFAPDGRAFVCNAAGISIVDPPYTSVAFTWPQPETGGTNCLMRRDGGRLAVTRRAGGAGIAFYDAPFTPASAPLFVPAPAGAGTLSALGVSPAGDALLVGQIVRASGDTTNPHARLWVLRQVAGPPGVSWEEIPLPSSISGSTCIGASTLCPGFEDMDVSLDGTLALVTGNSSLQPGFTARAPLVAIRNPFDTATRAVFAVTIGDMSVPNHGRGTGSVRFLAPNLPLMRDGFE